QVAEVVGCSTCRFEPRRGRAATQYGSANTADERQRRYRFEKASAVPHPAPPAGGWIVLVLCGADTVDVQGRLIVFRQKVGAHAVVGRFEEARVARQVDPIRRRQAY